MSLQGRVENGVVVFQNVATPLPEGTVVEINPLRGQEGNGAKPVEVPEERRQALLDLIGLWKVANPPDDDAVERIIEDSRLKKHG